MCTPYSNATQVSQLTLLAIKGNTSKVHGFYYHLTMCPLPFDQGPTLFPKEALYLLP